jgi:hypothetical protein
MSPVLQRYLVLEQGVGAAIFNLLVNAAIAWATFRGLATVPLWGQQSVGGDTIGTAFVLPFLTTLIASRIVRAHVRSGRIPALAWGASPWRRLPTGLVGRGLVLGVACIVAVGLPTAIALGAVGVDSMTFGGFIAFKATFAAALAALVTPLVARAALADAA